MSLLNEEFPDTAGLSAPEYAERILSAFPGRITQTKDIFGMKCTQDELFNINFFLNSDEKGKISLTMQDVEIWRVRHHITKSVTPLDWLDIDYSQGLIVNNVNSIYDVFYGLLYFYAFNGLKLVKCGHCGRWFATKTFKDEYCKRTSPCFDVIVKGKEPLPCKQAVKNIFKKCGRIRNRIETNAAQVSPRLHDDSFIARFQQECEPLYLSAKAAPTVQNLTNYYNFLKETKKGRGWLV